MTSVSPALAAQLYRRSATPGTIGGEPPSGRGPDGADAAIGAVADVVAVSPQGRRDAASAVRPAGGDTEEGAAAAGRHDRSARAADAEQAELRELQNRDREVRAHEQAHLAAAGSYARGGASFVYQKGPDGRMYAVGGEVGIDIGRAATPEETIAKMRVVRRAALAPAEPSAADRQIAALASIRQAEAQRQLQAAASNEQDATVDYPAASGSPVSSPPPATLSPAAAGVSDNRRLLAIDAYRVVNELIPPSTGHQ